MAALADLSWLRGSWRGGEGTRQTEEHWTHIAGGTMLGMGRTVASDQTVHREHMCILERDGEIVYEVTLPGQAPVEFRLVSQGQKKAVFENLAHDFPQRILYSREADVLHARIEDAAGHRRMEWSWRRAEAW
jgi:hypothetical protein